MTNKQKAIELRKLGRTFGEISKELGTPKGTLSGWLKNTTLLPSALRRLDAEKTSRNQASRTIAVASNKRRRTAYLDGLEMTNAHLAVELANPNVAKITLAALYLCEGTKNRAAITFGNSDPRIIALFLRLLRQCYPLKESKFRCTVQCRADQDVPSLERFWSETTAIHPSRFYQARIDPRSKGKTSKKPEYKGVCRIDYLSANVFNDVTAVANAITKGR